jgi:Ala-tRNA(Pro) deacylase
LTVQFSTSDFKRITTKEKTEMVNNVFEKLVELFTAGGARFRSLEHAAGSKSSQSVAEIRGTELGQGAKALVLHTKGNGVNRYVLAVLPADMQADLTKVAVHFGARRASLASPDEVMDLTGCVFGAVPPVSFDERLALVMDPHLFTRYGELAFNAGHLDRSIIISTKDFQRIVPHEEVAFCRTEEAK